MTKRSRYVKADALSARAVDGDIKPRGN
jgi:hypothetical protein